MIGHRVMGISLLSTGKLADSRTHFDSAITLYDPAAHRSLTTRFGHDNRVAVLSYRSWAQWFLGKPETSLADANLALADAREIGEAATLLYALFHASFPDLFCGNNTTAKAMVDELVTLAEEKGSAMLWKPMGNAARRAFCIAGMQLLRCRRERSLRGSPHIDRREPEWSQLHSVLSSQSLFGSWPFRRRYALHWRSNHNGRNDQGKVVGCRTQSRTRRNRAVVA